MWCQSCKMVLQLYMVYPEPMSPLHLSLTLYLEYSMIPELLSLALCVVAFPDWVVTAFLFPGSVFGSIP